MVFHCRGDGLERTEAVQKLKSYPTIQHPQEAEIKKSIAYYIKNSVLLRKHKPIHLMYRILGLFGASFQIYHEIMPYRYKEELILVNFLYDNTQHELISLLFGNQQPSPLYKGLNNKIHISQRENKVMLLIAEGLRQRHH